MISQFFIALFGVTAVMLSQMQSDAHRKWAPIFGLIGQPFWFYSAWQTQQWGIFLLCFLYTAAWLKGLKLHWFSKSPNPSPL